MEPLRFYKLGDGALGIRMKVAFINDGIYGYALSDDSAVGGSERQQWLLARALASSGWSVCVGVRKGLKSGERRVIEGIEFHGIVRGKYLFDCYRFLSAARPDWVYWRGATHWLGPIVRIAHLIGAQTIFAAAFDSDVHPRSALDRRKCWWPLYAWGLSQTDLIFVQHGRQFEELPSRWRHKANLIKCISGESDDFASHSSREPYVAWVGMLREPKRPDLLIEIAKRSPDIRYIVCGGATLHRSATGYSQKLIDQLRALTNIDYRGQVPPQYAEQIIAGAAVLLCTSVQEGFPNTFLQAWSSGTPVVTMQVDPHSIIKELDLGAVTGSVGPTIQELRRLIQSPEERQKIGARCRRYIFRDHRPEVIAKAFAHAIRPSQSS
jgi:glycosyltransferase involved in cell wall biosynthesis